MTTTPNELTFYEGWEVDFGYVPVKAEDSFEVGFDNIAS
jgi:hypothetical protein